MLERILSFAIGQVAAVYSLLWRLAPALQHPHRPLPAAEPALLSSEDTWTRATGAITAALAGFERMQAFQAAAAAQIDAADYVLRRLVADLGTVMPIPADGAPLRALLAKVAEPAAKHAAEDEALAA
jgi:hypothetical protein